MDWLKEIRVCAQKTQEEVANASNITQPSYANIEAGRRTPAVPTAKKIAAVLGFDWRRFYEEPSDVLGCTVDELLRPTDKKENPA